MDSRYVDGEMSEDGVDSTDVDHQLDDGCIEEIN